MVCEEDKKLLRAKVWFCPEEMRESLFDEISICFDYAHYQELQYKIESLEVPADLCYIPYHWQFQKFLKQKVKHPNN